MCGRVTITKYEDLDERLTLEERANLPRLYNGAPTNFIPLWSSLNPDAISLYRWGLVPSWAKDSKIGYSMINARCETLHEKPAFKRLIKNRRCLVIADGFYEWKTVGGA